MKRIVTMLSALLTAVTLTAQTGSGLTTTHDESGYVPEGYELAWSDEFDGDDLNTDDWKFEIQNAGWVNHELQR